MDTWWGEYRWQTNQTHRWNMASLALTVTRLEHEWQIRLDRPPISSEELHTWSHEANALPLPDSSELFRHVFRSTRESLRLTPKLADRAVVARPTHPIFIPPGEEVRLFISTPLWLAFSSDKPETLVDIPVVRPSDTWFGPTTWQGEICYSTEVTGRLNLDELPQRPFRAVTPITIVNNGSDPFPLERLALPVRHLPLHASETGRLWTPSMRVVREDNIALAEVRIEQQVDRIAGKTTLLSEPREPLSGLGLTRALDSLFAYRRFYD